MHGRVRLRPSGAGTRPPRAAHAGRRRGHPPSQPLRRAAVAHPPAARWARTCSETSTRPSICAAPGWSTGRSARCCSTSACLPASATSSSPRRCGDCRVDPFAPVSALGDDRLLALAAEAAGRAAARRRRRWPAAARGLPARAGGPARAAAGRSAAPCRARPGAAPTGARPAPCSLTGRAVSPLQDDVVDRARGALLGPGRRRRAGRRPGVAVARADHGALRRPAARHGGVRDVGDGGVDGRHGDDAGAGREPGRPRRLRRGRPVRPLRGVDPQRRPRTSARPCAARWSGHARRTRRGRWPSATTRSPAAAAPATAR